MLVRLAGTVLTVLFSVGLTPRALLAVQEARPLGAPLARSAKGFTHVYDVAELADGRVLLTDSRERSLALVDLTRGVVVRLGRRGEGPREYQSVFSILPRSDGSFAVYDSNLQRLTVVSAAGELVGSETFRRPPLNGFSAPRGPDRQGRWYIDAREIGPSGLEREATLYRWDPTTGRTDAVATVMQYAPGQGGRGIVPMPLADAWSFMPDGSVAKVVASDYHVEWSRADGGWTTGPRLPHRRVRVGAAEREAWVRALLSGPRAGVGMSNPGGAPSGPGGEAPVREFDPDRFPENLPAFAGGYTPASPRGHVWLELETESSPERTVFDVIDSAGRLANRVAVSGRARVVGFGPGSVYVARMDELELEWLERYAYPQG